MFMGNMMGKGEETKAFVSSSEIIHQGISAVDNAQANIKAAQMGTYKDPKVDPKAFDEAFNSAMPIP